jgi:thiopeptide-type bacteriocin biosynthesis protein
MVMSLARYLVRMRGRATPFGVFAGVAPLRFGQDVSARWTESGQHIRTRADAVWLAGVVAQLESCPALRHRLSVMVNDLVFVRAERLVVPWQPHAGDPARSPLAEVSMRHGPAVQTVLDAARAPIQVGDLIGKLVAEIPGAAVSAIDGMLAELVACGVLITSLRPPSTSADGLGHVLDRLQEVEAGAVEEVAPLVQELRLIHAELEAADCSARWVDGQARRTASRRMRALSGVVEQPLMVTLRLGCTVVLPPQVAAEAESAAEALLRLTPAPAGNPAWRDYHTRFLDRYGAAALVPVEQLVDTTAGLGFPMHYGGSVRPVIPAEIPKRDERLLVLAQQAALDGAQEIVLDDAAIERLAVDDMDGMQLSTDVELCAEVRAPTVAALAEGAFTLAVIGVSLTGVAMAGRFLDILPDDDRQRMISLYGQLPVGVDGALPAQLSFPPRYPRMENVARAPLLLPEVISLAEHRDGVRDRIPVQDLAVTADNDRLYLVSLSRRRVVEPMMTNAAARHTMPPIARFLFEIPRSRTAAMSTFAWGAAACLPFLPRVRHGRSVLALARWRIPAGELPGPDAQSSAWTAAMAAVRDRLRLPASVYAGTTDRRLRLNLDEPMDLALLRAHLDGAGNAATVSEAPAAADHGWFAGRAHEIVIPLAATAPPARGPAIVTLSGPLPLIGREHGILPGSQVLFAKLYGHPDGFDTILTRHLTALLSAWDEPLMWWFVRYRDPDPHLRLRLHLASGHGYGQAADRLGAWAAGLRRRGLTSDLVLDTYHPETARYGSGAALAAAEAVFAADSSAVVAQLAALAVSREVSPRALTAASLVDLASAMAGGLSAGMRWLIDHAHMGQAPAFDRDVLRQAVSLASFNADRSALQAISGGPQIAATWQARRQVVAAYSDRLGTAAAHVEQTPALTSLLHMHHVRARGINPDSERECHRLARAVALAWTARRDTVQEGRR